MGFSSDLSSEALRAAGEKLAAEISASEAVIAEEERKLALLREERHLISRLLELRADGAPSSPGKLSPEKSYGSPALEATLEELSNAGRPLHISHLFRALQERSVPIPGSGQQANLIALLTRDPRIYRPERGFYALAQWRSEQPPSSPRTRRVHVRVRKPENETTND